MEALEPAARQLEARLDKARVEISGMNASLDDAISTIQKWRLNRQEEVARQMEAVRCEVERTPPCALPSPALGRGTEPSPLSEISRADKTRPCSSQCSDENAPQAHLQRPPSTAMPTFKARSQVRLSPSGSAVLAARAAMLSLEQEAHQSASKTFTARSTRVAHDIASTELLEAQEKLTSETVAISDSFHQLEQKLLNYSSGIDDVLERLQLLDEFQPTVASCVTKASD